MTINTKALDRTASDLRLSVRDVHTVVENYLDNLPEGKKETAPADTVAVRYSRGWYVVGERVQGKKNLPDDVEVINA